MPALYFGIASLILGIAILVYIVGIVRKEGTPQSYFGPVSMAIIFIVVGIALIYPFL